MYEWVRFIVVILHGRNRRHVATKRSKPIVFSPHFSLWFDSLFCFIDYSVLGLINQVNVLVQYLQIKKIKMIYRSSIKENYKVKVIVYSSFCHILLAVTWYHVLILCACATPFIWSPLFVKIDQTVNNN